MQTLELDGSWRVLERPLSCKDARGLKAVTRTRSGWLASQVPGEIHLDLMGAGRMPEPLVGTNAAACRWPEKRSWWYRTRFDVSEAFRALERQELILDGVDLYGQIFLNCELLGETRNAFVPAIFDVRRKLRARRNELVIRVTCGTELAPADQQPEPISRQVYGNRNKFRGRVHLRKPQFSYGWDWIDALPNIGLWRSVRLRGASGVVVDDLRLDTVISGDAVYLDTTVDLENLHAFSERQCTAELTVTSPKGNLVRHAWTVGALPGLSRVMARLAIPTPELWWPRGMGDQPLYDVKLTVRTGRRMSDRRTVRVGLRTVALDRSPIPAGGSRFCLKVNGEEVFCRGGNWVPADGIMARVTPERYRRLVDSVAAANGNMLRVWGGGTYEDEAFYAACDAAGILVWQDFMFACAVYPDNDPAFREAVRDEATAVVRALRHHPCIALWSGNNENTWAFADWWNHLLAPGEEPNLGGARLYNRVLPAVCAAQDPSRPYWTGSPAGGERPNGEDAGDCHWWGQGTMNGDIRRRIDDGIYDECRARFVSEYGVIGPCCLTSTKEFLGTDAPRVGSKAWREHTNTFEKETTPAAIRYHYADPEGLAVEDYILYGQMFQALLYGRTIEAMRFRKHDPVDDCAGALIWMWNDCWGEHGWTPIDYYLRRKPSWYTIRQACAPVRAIVRRRGDELVTRMVNDTRQAVVGKLRLGWLRVDGTAARLRRRTVAVLANGMVEFARETIPADLDQTDWIYAAIPDGALADLPPATWQGVPHRALRRPEPVIRVKQRGRELELSCDTYAHGVHLDDQGAGLLEDSYIDLLPGVPRRIRLMRSLGRRRLDFRAVG